MNMKKIITRKAWSDSDTAEMIALYNMFLAHQQAGEKYTKAAPIRALAEKKGRSKGSIEAKMMNLSAVYRDLGMEWVTGYKPLSNYAKSLKDAVTGE